MEELTKFVTGQFQKKMNEKSFKDILKSDEGEFDFTFAKMPLLVSYGMNHTSGMVRQKKTMDLV